MGTFQGTPGPWQRVFDSYYGYEIRAAAPSRVIEEYRRNHPEKGAAWCGTTLIARCPEVINGSGLEYGPRVLMDPDEREANERLIAAATELLGAAEEAFGALAGAHAADDSVQGRARARLRDAIKLAVG
jgi:hypothetical protein